MRCKRRVAERRRAYDLDNPVVLAGIERRRLAEVDRRRKVRVNAKKDSG